jgi:hypothetical protein
MDALLLGIIAPLVWGLIWGLARLIRIAGERLLVRRQEPTRRG